MRGMPKRRKSTSEIKKKKPGSPGDFIRHARESLSLSKTEIMRQLNMKGGPQYFCNVEKDRQVLAIQYVVPLCRMLRVPSAELRRLYAEKEIAKIRLKWGLLNERTKLKPVDQPY